MTSAVADTTRPAACATPKNMLYPLRDKRDYHVEETGRKARLKEHEDYAGTDAGFNDHGHQSGHPPIQSQKTGKRDQPDRAKQDLKRTENEELPPAGDETPKRQVQANFEEKKCNPGFGKQMNRVIFLHQAQGMRPHDRAADEKTDERRKPGGPRKSDPDDTST